MLFVAVMLATFFIMEGITWLTHKYVMHGFLWVLHEDHHQPTGHVLEKNDAFFLIFAIPSMGCIFYGTIMGSSHWSWYCNVWFCLFLISRSNHSSKNQVVYKI